MSILAGVLAVRKAIRINGALIFTINIIVPGVVASLALFDVSPSFAAGPGAGSATVPATGKSHR